MNSNSMNEESSHGIANIYSTVSIYTYANTNICIYIYICKYICIYMRMHMQTHIHIHGTGADSGPGVFNDLYFKHYVWICLKLWRRDDFVIYPELKMLFSSHVTLGIYSLIIEFYWDK